MAPDHRKQIDNLKKFSVDFRVSTSYFVSGDTPELLCTNGKFLLSFSLSQLQSSSNPDPAFDQMMTKPPRDPADKPKDLPLDKTCTVGREGTEEGAVIAAAPSTATSTSKPGSPAALSPSPSAQDQKRTGLDVTSQGVQTTATSTFSGVKQEEKEEKKEAVQE